MGNKYDVFGAKLHDTQFEESRLRAIRSCNILERAQGDPVNKTMVLRCCVAKRVEHAAKLSSWTGPQLQELDRVFSQVYKRLSSNHYTFPSDLLYLSTDNCGLGYHSISDDIQHAKYSMLQRHLKTGGTVAENMDTLIFNASLMYAQYSTPGTRTTLFPRNDLLEDCWAHSLLMYAASGGMYLTRQGSPPGLSSTQIVTAPAGDEVAPQRDWISQRNISTRGDLYSLSQDGQASWHSFTPTEGSYIHRTLQAGVPPVEPIPLRPLQQWLPSSDSIYPPNTVVEILGFEEASPIMIRVRTYLSNNRDPVKTTSTINNSFDVMHGGSSNILLTPAQALGTYPRRVYMSHLHSRRKYRTINLIAEPTLYSINGNNPVISWLPDDMMDKLRLVGSFVIYSDGSWSSKGDP